MPSNFGTRIATLEWRLKLLSGASITSIVVLLCLLAGQAAYSAHSAENLRAHSLAIVDQNGAERLRLASPLPDPVENGQASKRRSPATGIQLNDAHGNERGGLVMLDDGTLTVCFDTKSSEATCMYVLPSGERGFSVTGDNKKDRAELALSSRGEVKLVLNDSAELSRLRLEVAGDGRPSMNLLSKDGEVIWSAPLQSSQPQ
jgi:hypothetical protein